MMKEAIVTADLGFGHLSFLVSAICYHSPRLAGV